MTQFSRGKKMIHVRVREAGDSGQGKNSEEDMLL